MNSCCKSGWLALLLAWTCVAGAAPKPGSAFPSWSRLTEQAAGAKVVLVDFWASWCGPCKASFPELDKLQAEFSARGFKVLAVSVDEKPAAMQAFLKEHPVSFKVLHDADQTLVAGAEPAERATTGPPWPDPEARADRRWRPTGPASSSRTSGRR